MKGMKKLLGVLVAAGLFTFSFSANAQENGNRDENGNIVRGAYVTNSFWDNWFIGVGAGVNATVANAINTFDGFGLATDVNVGKWITPAVGVRAGWKGLKNTFDEQFNDAFTQHYFHADFLWNLSNSFSGYKETRFWDVIPYATVGDLGVDGFKNADWEYAVGAGILNDLRLGKHVDLFLDVQALAAHARQYNDNGRFFFPVSATAGLIFNLGRTNFDRLSSVMPVIVPVPFTVDQYNALKDRVAALEKENASLKDEIARLKAQTPDTVYVGKESEVEPIAKTFFAINSSVINDREKAHLDFFAANVINKSADDKVYTITGSADKGTGSVAGNAKLAEARANAVKNYLVKKCGVAESKLAVESLGGVDGKPASALRCTVIK